MLPYGTHVLKRPVAEDRFAEDIGLLQSAPLAAIVRGASMITQDEKVALRDFNGPIPSRGQKIGGKILFRQRIAVHINSAASDLQPLARKSDDPLNV